MQCFRCGKVFARRYTMLKHQHTLKCSSFSPATLKYSCPVCTIEFSHVSNLHRHVNLSHPNYQRNQSVVGKDETNQVKSKTSNLAYGCGVCCRHFSTRREVISHRKREHKGSHDFSLLRSAHNEQTQAFRMFFDEEGDVITLDDAFAMAFTNLKSLLEKKLTEGCAYFKVDTFLSLEMYKTDEEGRITVVETFAFKSEQFVIRPFTDINYDLAVAMGDIERGIDEFLFRGSGWRILQPLFFDVNLYTCYPLVGGDSDCQLHIACYASRNRVKVDTTSVKLQSQTDVGLCFYYSVAAYFCGDKKLDILTSFLNIWGKPAGPYVSVKNVGKVEDAWSVLDIGVNIVYQDEENRILPVRSSPKIDAKHQIVLLLFHTGEDNHAHFALVKNPENLFSRRVVDKNGKMRTYKRYVCWNCANAFSAEIHLKKHKEFCMTNTCQQIEMPEPGDVVSFHGGDPESATLRKRTFKSALMLFYDFECLNQERVIPCSCSKETMKNTQKMKEEQRQWDLLDDNSKMDYVLDDIMQDGCYDLHLNKLKMLHDAIFYARRNDDSEMVSSLKKEIEEERFLWKEQQRQIKRENIRKKRVCRHKTQIISEHVPFAYNYILIDRNGVIHARSTYVGKNAAKHFVESVLQLSDKFLPELCTPGKDKDVLSPSEVFMLKRRTRCYLCDEYMHPKHRVIDHDHLTGAILGVAHSICNLQRKEQCTITAFAHNFSGYDSHLLVRDFNKNKKVRRMDAIPLNTQKFKCFTVNNRIKFLDSYAFLPDSLLKIVENLKASGCSFSLLDSVADTKTKKDLLLRKGIYPYSFATSIKRLQETKALPPRKCFENELTGGGEILESDYQHAQQVWKEFQCKDMLDYTRVYVESDVLQLAEGVIDMRNNVWQEFELDLCQYLSLPMLAKDIMLKTTGVEMELISDHEMSDFVQKNIRGGLSFINTRRAKKAVMRSTQCQCCTLTRTICMEKQ